MIGDAAHLYEMLKRMFAKGKAEGREEAGRETSHVSAARVKFIVSQIATK